MANHKSSVKRARQSVVKQAKNRARKGSVHAAIRTIDEAVTAKDYKAGMAALSKAQSELARAASKGTLPKKRAARKMSRLSARLKKVK